MPYEPSVQPWKLSWDNPNADPLTALKQYSFYMKHGYWLPTDEEDERGNLS